VYFVGLKYGTPVLNLYNAVYCKSRAFPQFEKKYGVYRSSSETTFYCAAVFCKTRE
jgi:hypothetical protein